MPMESPPRSVQRRDFVRWLSASPLLGVAAGYYMGGIERVGAQELPGQALEAEGSSARPLGWTDRQRPLSGRPAPHRCTLTPTKPRPGSVPAVPQALDLGP